MTFVAEPKPFASLTSSLLARKGGARPAMRRQATLSEQAHHDHVQGDDRQDDLGWNDMGDGHGYVRDPMAVAGLTPMAQVSALPESNLPESNLPALTPAPVTVPAVVEQRRLLAEKVAAPAAEPGPAPVSVAVAAVVQAPVASAAPQAQPRRAKAAFTLRLDPERHLRLRLACAVGNRSAQQIVTQALDAFLAGQPDIDALAGQVSRDTNDIEN
jgi:hypothetical protein